MESDRPGNAKEKERLETLTHVYEEGNISLAVAKSHREHFADEYHKRMEEIGAVRKEISILVLSDLKELMDTLREEEIGLQEKQENIQKRKRRSRPVSPWTSLIALTIFQALAIIQFGVAYGSECPASIPIAFLGLMVIEWAYFIIVSTN